MKAIMLDVDDVLIQWIPGFIRHMKRLGYQPIREEPTSWRFAEDMFPTANPEFVYSQIPIFNASPDFAYLEEYPEAFSSLITIATYTDWPMVAVTAPGLHPATVGMRAEQIEWFPVIKKMHILDVGEPKQHVYNLYDFGSIVVEDNAKHALTAAQEGHHAILVNRSHNINIDVQHELLTRVEGWHGIVNRVLEIARNA